MIKLAVKSRILLHNGDYVAVISDEKLSMEFRKEKVAESTHNAMIGAGVEHKFDGKTKIVQIMKGKNESEILSQVLEELQEARKNKFKLQILEWNYTKL